MDTDFSRTIAHRNQRFRSWNISCRPTFYFPAKSRCRRFIGRMFLMGIWFFCELKRTVMISSAARGPTGPPLLVRTIDNQWLELSITSALALTKLTKPIRCLWRPYPKLNSSLSRLFYKIIIRIEHSIVGRSIANSCYMYG